MKEEYYYFRLLFLLLININVLALDKLVLAPTADLVGGKGFISGELIGSPAGRFPGYIISVLLWL